MSPTDIAAWWGAGIATLVFFWDILKFYRTGRPVIKLRVLKNMVLPISDPVENQQPRVIVEAVNNGDRATTIQIVSLEFFLRKAPLYRKTNSKSFIVNATITQPLPHILESGRTWGGQIGQTAELEEMARSGYLYCQIHCSHSKKPLCARIQFN